MRRDVIHLGHPRFALPVRARLKVQSIGSGCKFNMHTESLRGWDLSVELHAERRHGFNAASLLEIWIDDGAGRSIYGLAKFLQPLGATHMLIRIIEIDEQNLDFLQKFLHSIPSEALPVAS